MEIPYLNAGRRINDFYVDKLPVLRGYVDSLPADINSFVVTADLQGREPLPACPQAPLRLLGEVLPQQLSPIMSELGIGPTSESGAILAGDFYTYPDLRGRGGTGNVTDVWQSFSDHFKFVVGVAGNHDTFGDDHRSQNAPSGLADHVHFLDESAIEFGGLQIGGVSGVIGNVRKNFRRSHQDFIDAIERVLSRPMDLLVLHDGPDALQRGCRGISEVREVLERSGHRKQLVVRGHKHWPTPLAELGNGVQVLNVEATVVILTQA